MGAIFRLSAFADEYDADFEAQLEGMRALGIELIEIRGVNGKNIADLDREQILRCRTMLDASGIALSAIGSPIGKVAIDAPIEREEDRLKRIIESAKMLGTNRIRMFSFHMEPQNAEKNRARVMEHLHRLLDIAKNEGILLCHENEKGIFGDTAERCADIHREMGGEMPLVFDPANLTDVGQEVFPHAYELMRDGILYLHIKDSLGDCRYVPAGVGCGRIGDLLATVNRDFDGKEVILTLEPHLKIFDGMQGLEKDMSRLHVGESVTYPDSHVAFEAATAALREILATIQP